MFSSVDRNNLGHGWSTIADRRWLNVKFNRIGKFVKYGGPSATPGSSVFLFRPKMRCIRSRRAAADNSDAR